MRRIAAALITAAVALPAFAQVDCGAPLTGLEGKYALAHARDLTLPLIEHNAGGLGPVLWTYISGQAEAESGLKGKGGGFALKPGLNLWNTQTMPGPGGTCPPNEVRSDTNVACKQENPVLVDRATAQLGQCWLSDEGEPMRTVGVCFRQFQDLGAAANNYLALKPDYTTVLQNLAKGTPSEKEFMDALDASGWADKPNRDRYLKDTKAAIDRAVRGLATLRQADTAALGNLSKEINSWCTESGQGDPAERQTLSDRQDALMDRLAAVGRVCTMPAGSTAPAANRAIDTCRTEPDPPPGPSDGPAGAGGASGQGTGQGNSGGAGQRPAGGATGTGEPHYRLPGGRTLSTQRAGEFWLLDAPDGTRIQVRQVPWGQSRQVAAIGAIAAQAGTHRVGVYADGRVLVDGKALEWTGRFHQQALGEKAVVGVWGPRERPSQVAVMWRNGRTLRVHLRSSWLDVETTWARSTGAASDRGLIGRGSSTSDGALIGRDGRRGQLASPDQADTFVASWRIQATESLFDYGPGESPATFDLRGFPKKLAKPTREALETARATCAAAGVPADRLEACAFDLAVTGSKEFLVSHLPVPAASPKPSPESKAAPLGNYPALFTPDIANPLQTLPNGKRFDVSISAGEQRTYHIDANRGDPPVFLNVISNNLSCVAEEVDGSKPAYQLFDARGRPISKAKPMCADLFTADVEEGNYYLVIKGADAGGQVEASLEAWAN